MKPLPKQVYTAKYKIQTTQAVPISTLPKPSKLVGVACPRFIQEASCKKADKTLLLIH